MPIGLSFNREKRVPINVKILKKLGLADECFWQRRRGRREKGFAQ
jgi:hypothetical protein